VVASNIAPPAENLNDMMAPPAAGAELPPPAAAAAGGITPEMALH
jgi:hypothetical protein